jgi:hypothetical protein
VVFQLWSRINQVNDSQRRLVPNALQVQDGPTRRNHGFKHWIDAQENAGIHDWSIKNAQFFLPESFGAED